MTKKQVTWAISNSIFALALYFGVWLDISLVGYLIVFFVWLTLAFYLIVLYSGDKNKVRESAVPAYIDLVFDIGILAILVISDWYLTATAYALSAIVLAITYRNSKNAKPQ